MIASGSKEDAIYRAVRRAAEAGQACPANSVLADIISAGSVSTPVKLLSKLQARNLLTVQRYQKGRQVVFPDGLSTLKPSATAPHWRDRGQVKKATPKPPRYETNMRRQERQCLETLEKKRQIEALRIPSREPCLKCGVRGDVGCAHNPIGEVAV